MSRRRWPIEGPIAVGGGKIAGRLLKRLLSDLGDNQDQLPILQHAMMRTWDYWIANREPGESVDIRHYNAVGKISQALSLHANEAFDELTSREKEIAEVLFKSLTEKNNESQGLRRPSRVKTIAELADASEAEVIKVIEEFRKPGRSFLMPGIQVPLNGNTSVEISHESLMRIWTRLNAWVDEEFDSAQMYKRISEAAAMYQIGKTGLWRPPDLQLALNWQKKQRPTRTWAQRYDEAFERAIVFLDTSRITYEAELKNQEMLQQRMLRRARVTNAILVVCLVVAIAFFFYGLIRQFEAERQATVAEAEKANAIKQEEKANEAARVATERQKEVERQAAQLRQKQGELEIALNNTRLARDEAQAALKIAEQQTLLAERATDTANIARADALRQYERAQIALAENNRLLYLNIAQSMEAKSVGMDDKDLASLLAMQGYIFHTRYGGERYDPYVFSGLYHAVAKQSGYNYNEIRVAGKSRNRMFSIAMSRKNNSFYTTGNDGRIIQGSVDTQSASNIIAANPYPNRVVALSNDEQYLAVGSDSSNMQVINLSNNRVTKITGHKSFVNDIKFLPDDAGFISASADKTLRLTNQKTGTSELLTTLPFDLKKIDISRDSKWLVGASSKGQVIRFNLATKVYEVISDEAPNRVLSIALNPSNTLVAYGVEVLDGNNQTVRGTVKLYDFTQQKITKQLSGHKSGISDLEFSPDGLLLASAGLDKKLQMWVVEHPDDLPIEMTNNNGNIWDIAFTKDNNHLVASCNSGEIRVWPTDPKALAELVCPKLTRNMTREEWQLYVEKDKDPEITCANVVIENSDMRKLLTFVLVIAATLAGKYSFAQGDTDCLAKLSTAENEFAAGRFYGIPAMLDDCLKGNRFSNEEKVRVYMLLTQVYLLIDNPTAADDAYLRLLNANPEFVPSDLDPIDVVYLSKKFTSTPIFTPHFKAGGNLSSRSMIYTQNTISTPDVTRVRNLALPGWTVGGGIEWNVNDNLGVGIEGLVSQKRFRTKINNMFTNDDETTEERQLWLDIPIYVRYGWNKGKIRPFAYAGGAVNLLWAAKVDESYNDRSNSVTGEVTPVQAPARGVLYQRNVFNRSLVFGGGAKFKIGKDFIVTEFRYMPGLSNVVNQKYVNYSSKDRENLNPSLTQFASMSGLYRVNNFSITVGFVTPIYNPRKASRVKTKSVSRKLIKDK
ncbi:MAG: outer membrane beta-barrel protein [Bacteroidota bacterium]